MSGLELARATRPAAHPADWRRVFPLSLAPLEILMLVDDRPNYPMTFFGELCFSGTMSRSALEAALQQAMARHPLLDAQIEVHSRRYQWVAAEKLPSLSFESGCQLPADGDACYPRPERLLDLRHGPGLRLWVRTGADSSRMLLEFHHACCDGQGAMRFIGDLLALYAMHVSPEAAVGLGRLDPELLLERAVFQPRPEQRASGRRRWLLRLQEAAAFHLRRPRPLVASHRVSSTLVNNEYPGTQSHYFDPETSAAIQQAARRHGASLNDVALALLYRVLASWQAAATPGGRAGNLKILVPSDLRERRDAQMPASNRMSLYFMLRRQEQCRSLDELLAGIRRETQYLRQSRLGLDLLGALARVSKRPALLRLATKLARCQATAVLTNMSDPTRGFRHWFPRDAGRLVIGDVRLERITGSPPLRPGTRAGFGIGIYAGRIVLNLKCDPWLFTAAETRGLLDRYVAAWHDFAAAGG